MGRKPCCDKVGLKRGPWSVDEDRKLTSFVLGNGIHCWRTVPKLAGLLRCGKSCRLRWINYLRPDLKRGGFTEAEEDEIIQLHAKLGNRWSKIASHFDGRTDNEIKNHWNTKIKKRLKEMVGGVYPTMSQVLSVEPKKEAPNARNQDEGLDHGAVKNSLGQDNDNNMGEDELDSDDLLSNYDIFNGSLEVIEHWLINEDSISTGIDGQSSSASLPESSLNTWSTSEFSFQKQSSGSIIQDDEAYLHQWFDEMDSFFGFSCHQNDQQLHPPHLP